MTEFEMSEEQLATLLDACKSTPAMYLPGGKPMCGTPQENANRAWNRLGKELGFVGDTARPHPSKGQLFFMAEPTS